MPPAEMPHGSGRRRPLGAFIVLVVLCLIAFGVGVFVGKQQNAAPDQVAVAPDTHKVVKQPVVPVVNEVAATTAGVDNAAAEKVGLVKELDRLVTQGEQTVGQVLNVKPAATPEAVPAESTPVSVEQTPLGNGVNKVVSVTPPVVPVSSSAKAVVTAAPSAAKKNVEQAAGQTRNVSVGTKTGYVVQVCSFRKRDDAAAVEKKLQSRFSTYIKRADLGKKGVWFRVLVGPVATSVEAGKLKQQLQQGYKLAGFVKKINR